MSFDSILFYGTLINADKHGYIRNFFAFGNRAWAMELHYTKFASNLRFQFSRISNLSKRPSAAGAYHLAYPWESVPTCRGEAESEDGSVSR